MLYSLKRTAEAMAEEIAKYDIQIDPEQRTVGNRERVTVLDPYSSSRKCRSTINYYLKIAKAKEAEKLLENQTNLL